MLPELLAPAGSWAALQAAVGSGADAVYLAGTRFGARAYADNFDKEQLIAALEYAHRANVSVYVTVNTLIAEEELIEAGKFLLSLYEQGVDGVLVQDPGLIHFARKRIPGLTLHASTQMTLHNSDGVQWAAEMGLQRVVLARELDVDRIRRIADHLQGWNIGLEIFIHGALCYSYSGQCLLSSVIGGRSGNRGRCAQPCRKPYRLVQGLPDVYDRIAHPQIVSVPSYCLSTRDLSTYLHLDEILRLPVDALKIEGRMKSPEYVATVVRIYRTAIDEIASGDWTPRKEDVQDLLLAFNRGFTGGLLFDEPVMGTFRPDHRGLLVGTVMGYDTMTQAMKVRLSSDTVPEKGDGIYLVTESGEERGLRMTQPISRSGSFLHIFSSEPVKPGTSVYITDRASLNRIAAKAMKRSRYRQIPADVEVSWNEGRAIFQGTIHDRKRDLPFRYQSSLVWEEARTHPLTPAQIIRQLQKSGATPFALHVHLLRYPGGLFLPLSALNTVRREVLSFMESLLLKGRRPTAEQIIEARAEIAAYHPLVQTRLRNDEPLLSTYVHSVEGVRAAVEGGSDSVCLDADLEGIFPAAALCREKGISLYWIWPRIIPENDIGLWLSGLKGQEVDDLAGIMIAAPGIARAVRKLNSSIRLTGTIDLNIWNHCSIQALASLFDTLVLSPELSLAQIQDLVHVLPSESPSLAYIVQGNLEVMVSEHCPDERIKGSKEVEWGLLDVRDRLFPARTDADGRTHIYNAVETCYIDHLSELKAAGINSFAIEGRFRSSRYIREMVSLYREALRRISRGEADCADLKEEVQKRTRGGITMGPLMQGLREN